MYKSLRNTGITLGALLCLGCSDNINLPAENGAIYSKDEATLKAAQEIVVQEEMMNIGKDYDILVDDTLVAHVRGKNLKLWADTFVLTTVDGKMLAYEKEHRPIFQLARSAAIYDATGELSGYLGEEPLKDFFSIAYIFHFYDAQQKERGKSWKVTNSSLGMHKIEDVGGEIDYDIDKKFTLLTDKYVINVIDSKSQIPLEHAILLTCIEDAIGDAHEKSSDDDDEDD